MMKRIVSALLFLSLLFCVSCGDSTAELPYTFTTETFTIQEEKREIAILYPVISGENPHESVNRQLLNKTMSFMELFLLYAGSGDTPYRYTIDSVTACCVREELVSFLCTGNYSEEGASHPTPIVYALNIDPRSGELLTFDNIVSSFPALSEAFLAGRFTQEGGEIDLLEETNYEDMFVSYSDLYGIYPPVYFIGDPDSLKLGIIVELAYALGGWATFSIDFDDIRGALTEHIQALIK